MNLIELIWFFVLATVVSWLLGSLVTLSLFPLEWALISGGVFTAILGLYSQSYGVARDLSHWLRARKKG